MKRTFFILLLSFGLVLSLAVVDARAQGRRNSPAQLVAAGWTCFNVPGLGVHCMPPGANFGDVAIPILYFDTTDPNATQAPFSGTELLLREDKYRGQPCPQEGTATYHHLAGLGYYACHHR